MTNPLFVEQRVDIEFTGTINVPPTEFMESEPMDGISIEYLSAENGYTYTVTVLAVDHAKQLDDGSWTMTYRVPEFDDGTVEEFNLQVEFSITEITT